MTVLMMILAVILATYIGLMAWSFIHCDDNKTPPDKWEENPLSNRMQGKSIN